MAFRRPLLNEGHLRMGVAPELDNSRADYILQRPTDGGFPEVIMIVDDDGLLPIYISDDEEEERRVAIGEGIRPLSSDDEDEDTEASDWSDLVSEDSGYDSMNEDEEEDFEDDDVRPHSPLVQQFRPGFFQPGWREVYPLDPAGPLFPGPLPDPQRLTVQHQELPGQQVEPSEEGPSSAFQRSEECAPSTSGLSSSTKRSREEKDAEQVSVKRQRCEESYRESAPSISGHGLSTNRSRDESYGEPAASTSGLGSSAKRSRDESYWEQAPSTSGLGSSAKRSRDESYGEPALSTSGLGSSANRNRDMSYGDPAPSTSGLGSSANRSSDKSYGEPAPSTYSLGSRRFQLGAFEYQMWADDSDSD